jgi:hypothetical protein
VQLPLVVSDHADWDELCATVVDTQCEELWVTHGAEEALVHWATQRGLRAVRGVVEQHSVDRAGQQALRGRVDRRIAIDPLRTKERTGRVAFRGEVEKGFEYAADGLADLQGDLGRDGVAVGLPADPIGSK